MEAAGKFIWYMFVVVVALFLFANMVMAWMEVL